MSDPQTAMILAGGLGTRLRTVIIDQPKVLAPVHGRPFLAYLLDQLQTIGIQDVILCTGYLGEQIKNAFGVAYQHLRLRYSREIEPLGTGGALRLAAGLVGAESVLVMNGDSYCAADLAAFVRWSAGREAALYLTQVTDTRRYGCVQVDEMGCVLSFAEKSAQTGAGWINAGIYWFAADMLRASVGSSLEREIFPTWVARGQLYGYTGSGRFLDIGTPESYTEAEDFFRESC